MTMPIDKFGRHHFNRDHDESQTFVIKEFPKLYYETRLLIVIVGNITIYKVSSPTGVIKHVTCPPAIKIFINYKPARTNDLIGKTLKEGDSIRLSWSPKFSTPGTDSVEFILKVPIIVENE